MSYCWLHTVLLAVVYCSSTIGRRPSCSCAQHSQGGRHTQARVSAARQQKSARLVMRTVLLLLLPTCAATTVLLLSKGCHAGWHVVLRVGVYY